MRAAVLTQCNAPWELKNLPDPRPAPGQVLIRVHASGMCGTDLHVHHGHMPGTQLPLVLGHEPVGEIVELGQGVSGLKVGDRVGVIWFQKGCGRCPSCQIGWSKYCPEGQSWMTLGGGNSELMLAWAEGCVLLPEGLSYEAAAPLFCAGYTMMSGLREVKPRPGERVAVLGIGGLGHLGLQLVRALGLPAIAVTGSESKRKDALSFGAEEVVVAGDHIGKALMATGGVDIILSTTNSAAQVSQAFSGLRPGGRLVNLGVTAEPISVHPFELLFQRQLLGVMPHERRDIVELLSLAAAGKVKPALETYPLEKANDVRERLEQGKVRYRAVLLHGRA